MDMQTSPLALLKDPSLLKTDALINGEWVKGSQRFDVLDPSNGRKLADVGHACRLFAHLLTLSPVTLKRFGLVRDQIFFLGNYSLAIIAVSGLFVGFVLGLQGYYTLQRYGSAEALGLLVALSLVRELGPVVTALLFAGRAGTALTAEIGLMKAGEQLSAMEMMAVDPVRRILALSAMSRAFAGSACGWM